MVTSTRMENSCKRENKSLKTYQITLKSILKCITQFMKWSMSWLKIILSSKFMWRSGSCSFLMTLWRKMKNISSKPFSNFSKAIYSLWITLSLKNLLTISHRASSIPQKMPKKVKKLKKISIFSTKKNTLKCSELSVFVGRKLTQSIKLPYWRNSSIRWKMKMKEKNI